MKLEIGNKEDVFEFFKNIGNVKDVALVSHTDLDGITSAKVVNSVVNTDNLFFVDYIDLNEDLISDFKEKGFKKIIFTDLYIKDKGFIKNLEEFADILVMDHHPFPDWNSEKTTVVIPERGYSAGFLCYKLLSELADIEDLDWLVACSCVSDYCHIKPKEWLENVFEKYGDNLEYDGHYVRKSGPIWDIQWNISLSLIYFKEDRRKVYDAIGKNFGDLGYLAGYSKEVKEEIDRILSIFEKEKEEFEDGYLFVFDQKFSVGSIISSIISAKDVNKMFITVRKNNGIYNISLRRQDKKVDCGKFLRDLLKGLEDSDGGGHVAAAGGHFKKEDFPEIKRRLGIRPRT